MSISIIYNCEIFNNISIQLCIPSEAVEKINIMAGKTVSLRTSGHPLSLVPGLGIHSVCELVFCTQTVQIALRDAFFKRIFSHIHSPDNMCVSRILDKRKARRKETAMHMIPSRARL